MKKILCLLGLVLIPFPAFAAFSLDLQYGSKGEAVLELQEFLSDQGVYSGPITGNFYSLTQTAVKRFQQKEGLTPAAGYFGVKTRTRANTILNVPKNEEGTAAPKAPPAPESSRITLPSGVVVEVDKSGNIKAVIYTPPSTSSPTNSPVPEPMASQQRTQESVVAPAPLPTFEIRYFIVRDTGLFKIGSSVPLDVGKTEFLIPVWKPRQSFFDRTGLNCSDLGVNVATAGRKPVGCADYSDPGKGQVTMTLRDEYRQDGVYIYEGNISPQLYTLSGFYSEDDIKFSYLKTIVYSKDGRSLTSKEFIHSSRTGNVNPEF